MINRIFVISNAKQAATINVQENNVFFSVGIDPAESANVKDAYLLFSNTKNVFSVFPGIKSAITKEAARDILSFLFISSYLQINGAFIVNVTSQSPTLADEAAGLLMVAAKEQGIENISINVISAGRVFRSGKDFLRYYHSVLESPYFFGNNLFFESNDQREIELLITDLKEAELSFEKNNPRLFSTVKDNLLLREENSLIARKIVSIESELSNQKEYADLLRSSHSTRKLQDYYTNEYEILPTWYKRVGHIIKVITGKRSFKSLLNDKLKKHND